MIYYGQTWLIDKYLIKGTLGLAIWPFMWFYHEKEEVSEYVFLHEKEHWKQQLRGLLIFFAMRYWGEYLYYRCRGLGNVEAYRNVSYERQAWEVALDKR